MLEQNENLNNRSLELCRRVVTTESFIAEAKEIYGDRYDYSTVEYKNRDHRVTVFCPVHGEFQVYAREHLDGKGCPKCDKGKTFLITKDKEGNVVCGGKCVLQPIHAGFADKGIQAILSEVMPNTISKTKDKYPLFCPKFERVNHIKPKE